jgi:hypothetical protein
MPRDLHQANMMLLSTYVPALMQMVTITNLYPTLFLLGSSAICRAHNPSRECCRASTRSSFTNPPSYDELWRSLWRFCSHLQGWTLNIQAQRPGRCFAPSLQLCALTCTRWHEVLKELCLQVSPGATLAADKGNAEGALR